MDIAIALLNGALTLLTAYLGVHLTMHPAETNKSKTFYKTAFCVCGLLIVALNGWQAYRNKQSSDLLASKLTSIEKSTNAPKGPTAQLSPFAQVPIYGFDKIAVGKQLRFNMVFKNMGPQIAKNPLNFVLLKAQDMRVPNAEESIRKYFKNGVDEALKSSFTVIRSDADQIPVGNTFFITTVPQDTFSEEQVNGLLHDRTFRLYLQTFVTWQDPEGNTGTVNTCFWIQDPQEILNNANIVLRACGDYELKTP